MTKLPVTNIRRSIAYSEIALAGMALAVVLSVLIMMVHALRAYGNEHPSRAHAVRVLNATDTAHLHYIRSSGSLLFEEGSASGTLPGKMLAHINIGPTVSASFTIYVRGGGTIDGHGTGRPHGSGIYESFAGSLIATGGTGRYSHAHGHAGLYGVFDRRSYAVTVQTTGRLAY
jgi:hypothetical protein